MPPARSSVAAVTSCQRADSTRRTRLTGGASERSSGFGRRQNEAKSCPPTSAAAPAAFIAARSSDVGSAANWSAPAAGAAPDRSSVIAVAPRGGAEPGVETRRRPLRAERTAISGPSIRLQLRWQTAEIHVVGQLERHDLPPAVHPGVGPSRAARLDRDAHDALDRGTQLPHDGADTGRLGEASEVGPVVGDRQAGDPHGSRPRPVSASMPQARRYRHCAELRRARCAPSWPCRLRARRA